MQNAGLSHTSAGDEVTAIYKQILLRSLKQKQKTTATSMSPSGVGIKVKSKILKVSLTRQSPKPIQIILKLQTLPASEALKAEQKKEKNNLKKCCDKKKINLLKNLSRKT